MARPISIAALAGLSHRKPLVVACPTGTMAGQLADDLAQFMEPDQVAVLPAWETLPFERVSPSVETMGQRLELLWRLRQPERCPAVIVAGVRALLQRLGPGAVDVEPIVVRQGAVIDPDELVRQLANFGYRREELVEHRGEFARRGAIIDVFPSTGDAPVRIDLWGDEVDRLTTFGVNDQRSSADVAEALIFPARELIPTDDVRARAKSLVATEPWGREQWERLGEGALFEGMESWMPWLVRRPGAAHRRAARVGEGGARRAAAEPRPRRRPARRGGRPGQGAGVDVGALAGADVPAAPRRARSAARGTGGGSPSPTGSARSGRSTRCPSHRTRRSSKRRAGDRSSATARVSSTGSSSSSATSSASSSPPTATGRRPACAACCSTRVSTCRSSTRDVVDLTKPGGRIVVAPLHHGVTIPSAKVAVIAESDLTGRRRAHRRPRARRRDGVGTFEDLKPGMYVVHFQHGVGRYEGMVKRAIGGVERDYLLLAYKGNDKLYVPSDQIDTLRQYVGGEAPTLHRLGGSDFAKAKSRVRSAVREIAQELVVLYQKRVNAEGYTFGHDTPWQAEMEDAFPYVETPDQRTAIVAVEGRHGAGLPDGPPRVRRRRLRQDRGGDPGRVQGDPGRQAGRRARADDAARHAARPDVRRPLRRLPDPGRDAQPLPHARPGQARSSPAWRRARSTASSAPTACCRRA